MTDKIPPLAFTWRADMGEHGTMVPRDHRAQAHFEDRQTYQLQVYEGRSKRSHDHFFAVIEEAWKNLPEHHAARFPTPEHFRKCLLIQNGFCTTTELACGTPDQAVKFANHLRTKDAYSVILVRGTVVTEFVAESQSQQTMGKDRFQDSKQKCLEGAAAMIGVSVEDLVKNTGRAA